MKYFLTTFITLFACVAGSAQQPAYSTANAHSHNDYEQAFPLRLAWLQKFGSVEADVFLDNGELIVAHDTLQLKKRWSLDSLYLQPLVQYIKQNKGYVYQDTSRHLQLLIDIKSEAIPTLEALVSALRKYPSLINAGSLHIVISGNRPDASGFPSWPSWIWFDGELMKEYSKEALERIVMLSDNFKKHSGWNGKGRLPVAEQARIEMQIANAHKLGKKIRFWNAPDMLNSWYGFIKLGVDYINTDHIDAISNFFRQLPDRSFTNGESYELYKPRWRNDGADKKIRNIILLIGDGTGLAQWYAGYTANRGGLNVFNMHHTGLSKTSSFDNYITDSAPGATAFSAGVKTNNRAVGVDHTGKRLTLQPEILSQRKMKTGIITSGDLRDATPAAFYAHQPERSSYAEILHDLMNAPVDIIMGACETSKQDSIAKMIRQRFHLVYSVDSITQAGGRPLFVADNKAALSYSGGRGNWAGRAFDASINILSANKEGFMLVLEGAQIDHGGHANKLPYAVSELLDFDQLIGKAMAFADSNGETLVIVTGDHETGGLTLTGGDYTKGYISGQFSTEDHTAIPVPVFAYGPQSALFDGVYENTEIFHRILKALKIREKPAK